ncbi:precorrin-6y C5,15-methyltransferase (decarboxylating) subunit CbiE [Desulfohalobiaceae bacterium Ax17]|jgi:precorrin-6y C5,15-methyltransferase (decarboxylating) CbiE subunit|uniref:precorrin-6y C5,15-methyltransferase (decarboxylating) subunit CbiE n=1 Tax=Desulfovulcanus ferrireducens TaxID=2831190 RepID=UPI00207BC603|nr:precorrin-6y C5,15-methyltransferase (decarboxylating) subunit CbiE [Desulfovulcanus ferrireducens]MBT8763547.1 precorrin-6y C5,15-methyltransferase (decarboxylating) subunit CbiE [Desulfovulcanus ferrireducens]
MINKLNKPKISIIGCGPGDKDFLTLAALKEVEKADILVGAPRLLELFPEFKGRLFSLGADIDQALEFIETSFKDQKIAVLVSGDPGCFSFSQKVVHKFGPENCHLVPGISSVQLALSRLKLEWTKAKIVSVHGREPEFEASELLSYPVVVILLGRDLTWFKALWPKLNKNFEVYLVQNLSLENERLDKLSQEADLNQSINGQAMLILEAKSEPGLG